MMLVLGFGFLNRRPTVELVTRRRSRTFFSTWSSTSWPLMLVDEARKVSTATMYLTGDASCWWRTKYAEIQANQVRLDTWDLLREAIRVQFFPENVEYNARRALRKLEHTGSMQDYVKSFLGADVGHPRHVGEG
ncbi:UNVERIFIED_CONTAM: hypothetical protein Sradi_7228900 [Sesamum radiatum]|uniref:Retrotransposon gag domain-containing protein n=1 Tax=Sesamum radiatum TaxID=300843 RepID=A0AAW2INN7_SESRA